MEVLANGMKANFWIPVEEEPDIDRFVDEQIMIDMDRFMLVGTLEKVSTCKKKNEEKEYEYFKQITIQVCNICLASDNNINIAVPAKKEEFLYEVKFRYAPEPEQVAGDGMEPADAEEGKDAEAELIDAVDDGAGEAILQEAAEAIAEGGPGMTGAEAAELGLGDDDEKEIVVTVTPGKPLVEVLDAGENAGENAGDIVLNEEPDPELAESDIDAMLDDTPANEDGTDNEAEPDFSFADEPAANAIVDSGPDPEALPEEKETPAAEEPEDYGEEPDNLDDEGIDWGE